MKLYHYDGTTGEYLYSDDARPDPLDNPNGEADKPWLIPAFATLEAAPDAEEGKVAKFNGETWEIHDIPAPAVDVNSQIRNAPIDLFGGPSLKDVFNGN